jgi:hypothetical protein
MTAARVAQAAALLLIATTSAAVGRLVLRHQSDLGSAAAASSNGIRSNNSRARQTPCREAP